MVRDVHNNAYSLLGYVGSKNLGDAIQTYAMAKFLGKNPDDLIDREAIHVFPDFRRLLVNGWLALNPEALIAGPNLDIKMISVHITERFAEHLAESHDLRSTFFRAGPVGTRDLYTEEILRNFGIDAFFSGCVTLTLDRPDVGNSGKVILNDLNPQMENHFSGLFDSDTEKTTNLTTLDFDTFAKVEAAVKPYLLKIAESRLVITSRLHTALPAIAMGVPTIFCPPNVHDPRFIGLLDFIPNTFTSEEAGRLRSKDLESIINAEPQNLSGFKEDFAERLGHVLAGAPSQSRESVQSPARNFSTVELIDRISRQSEHIGAIDSDLVNLGLELCALRQELDGLRESLYFRITNKIHILLLKIFGR
jgi:hypothetical protein